MTPQLPEHLRAIAPPGAHVAATAQPAEGAAQPAKADGAPNQQPSAKAPNQQPAVTTAGAAATYSRDFVVPKTVPVMVRDGSTADWADIWPFFRALVAAGESICLPNIMMGSDARTLWFGGVDTRVIVAVDPRDKPKVENPDSPIVGRVVGSASMRTARDGHGRHVARADVVVDPRLHGQGVERELGIAVLTRARAAGFAAVEIDPVVATDVAAIESWGSLGFEIVGTRPRAFEHPSEGMVGLHVMYRAL
jgi:GNAT superfamily N-acetyltransferase